MRPSALAVGLFVLAVPLLAQPAFPPPTVSPNIPSDVTTPFPGVIPNLPYFDDFSWQEFVAFTWPAKITCCSLPASRTILSTSSRNLPAPISRKRTPESGGIDAIASASVSTPCHGPNVPTKPATISFSATPNS